MALILKIELKMHIVFNMVVTRWRFMQIEIDFSVPLGVAKNDGVLLSNTNRPEL